jgi:hypothetical protein
VQKWEYRTVLRTRGWGTDTSTKDAPWLTATTWNNNIEVVLQQMGDDGWELVAVSPRSSSLGGLAFDRNKDYAGFTDSEIWVFKRPKS